MRYLLESKIGHSDEKNKFMKIGGSPIYDPGDRIDSSDRFLMEIYNNEIINGPEDILGWQIYQTDYAGPIENVIPIYQGNSLYSGNHVKTRRWLHEFVIRATEIPDKDLSIDADNDKYRHKSTIGGTPNQYEQTTCQELGLRYLGVLFESLTEDDELNFGCGYLIVGINEEGNLEFIQ